MANKKNSVRIFYKDDDNLWEILTPEEYGIVLHALAVYSKTGVKQKVSPKLQLTVDYLQAQEDKMNKGYVDKINGDNPDNAGNPGNPGNPDNPDNPDNPPIQEQDQEQDIKEKDPNGSKKKSGEPLSSATELNEIEDEALRAKTGEWIKYKKERREGYKPTGLKNFISQVKNNAAKYGAERVCAVISQSMSSGYKGVTWDRLERTNAPPQKEQIYDFDLPDVQTF